MKAQNKPITKERAEQMQEKISILKNHNVQIAQPEDKQETPPDKEIPFGGGQLLGLIINPTPPEVQALQGYADCGFALSRSYGCSQYLPLVQYCSRLIRSDDAVDRMVGYKHLGDRFMVRHPMSAPFSEAEEAIYQEANKVGQHLLERGAMYPLTFPSISVLGHNGLEPLAGHWVPSCGYLHDEVLSAFTEYMKEPANWLKQTRHEMENLHDRITLGLAAPIQGYDKET